MQREWLPILGILALSAVACGRMGLPVEGGGPGTSPTPNPSIPTRLIEVTNDVLVPGGPHVDFPVAVVISDPFLAGAVNVWFSADAAGQTPLDFEIESFDDGVGDLLAWVRIPSLTGSTSFYIHYNGATQVPENAPGVWSNGYAGVWHMNDDPGGVNADLLDSTPLGNDGNPQNMQNDDLVSGQCGLGLDFDGNNDWIDLNEPPELAITGEITIMAWVQPDQTGDYMGIAGKLRANGDNGYGISKHDTDRFRFQTSGNGFSVFLDSDDQYNDTNWHHVVGMNRGGTNYMYVDGVEQSDTNQKSRDDNNSFAHIGRQYSNVGNQRFWNGTIDEVRIADVPRSPEWIETAYNNMFDPTGFFSVGPEL